MLKLEEARRRILESLAPLPGREVVPLQEAVGRILATDIHAPFNLPREDNSAMDGYAIAFRGGQKTFHIVGKSFAGHPFQDRLQPGEAVRIFTGAPVPNGTDAIVLQEEARQEGDRLRVEALPPLGAWIRRRGSDVRTGELLFREGRRLQAADLGVLASFGLFWLEVRPLLQVAFFSTGEELRSAGEPLDFGEVYDSNRFSLKALLETLPVSSHDLGRIGDVWEETLALLERAGREFDLVISTGGASVGEADLLYRALKKLGDVRIWQVAVKPGKPLIFGRLERAWFFGLPGNPVSVHVAFLQFVRPAILRLLGAIPESPLRLKLPTLKPIQKTARRFEFQRGRLVVQEDGRLAVLPLPGQSSHQLYTLAQAYGFILLPEGRYTVEQGQEVVVEVFEPWQPFSSPAQTAVSDSAGRRHS